jgi:hypothetical protein
VTVNCRAKVSRGTLILAQAERSESPLGSGATAKVTKFAAVRDDNRDAKTRAAFKLRHQPSLRRGAWSPEQPAGPNPSQTRDLAPDQASWRHSPALEAAKTEVPFVR